MGKRVMAVAFAAPEWKPVDNPDALWGHESRQLELLAQVDDEKRSLRVEKVVRVLQR